MTDEDESISNWIEDTYRFYDRKGRNIGLKEWGTLKSDPDYKIVGQTKLGNFLVSTVWLGINHNFYEVPPHIFETIVWHEIDGNIMAEIGEMERYSNEEDAKEGHEHYVKKYRKQIEKGD